MIAIDISVEYSIIILNAVRKIRLADYKAMGDDTVTMRESLAYAITAITGFHLAGRPLCCPGHCNRRIPGLPCITSYHEKGSGPLSRLPCKVCVEEKFEEHA